MTFSALTNRTSGNAGQFSSRGGRKVRGWIIHHAATTSLNSVLSMMSTGSRSVSANYVLGSGEIIGVVPEEWRAWTSSSPDGDGENLTVEIVNNKVGATDMTWTIGEGEYANMAKLIAETATRYGFPINRSTIIGHREVIGKYGEGYSTACPSGVDLDRLVRMAQEVQSGARPAPAPPKATVEESMYVVFVDQIGHLLITPTFVRKIVDLPDASARDTVNGLEKLTKPVTVLPFPELYGIWSNVNAGTKDDSSTGVEIRALAKRLGVSR